MPKNNILNYAKAVKQDEFYTSLSDIEKEMRWYPDAFKDKTVYCNCDDADSNFYLFFKAQFNRLGLKKLVCTHYSSTEPSYMMVFDGKDESREILQSNGDFRSEECTALLDQADVVVTNPPFSLFREYIKQLLDHEKKFIILGNITAVTAKEVFPYIKEEKVWLGASIHAGDREFRVPDSYEVRTSNSRVDENGVKYVRVAGVRWYTNIDHKQRHEPMILVATYSKEKYETYDGHDDVINVNKTKDIPKDYDGMIGVPITFLDKLCPEQFELLGELNTGKTCQYDFFLPTIDDKHLFKRLLIRSR